MAEICGIVFNIQRFMTHDGSGIRSNAFLKGCPLRCQWCSNPESQHVFPDMYFNNSGCIGCRLCVANCSTGALKTLNEWCRAECSYCRRCENLCPTCARQLVGRNYTVEELVYEMLRDRAFFERSGGGCTFSGGEPLMQADFVTACARRLKDEGIHLAIETCGYALWEEAKSVFELMDCILYDVKHMDPEKHRRLTGVDNKLILENAGKAAALGRKMILRAPVIGGLNDEPENITALASFAAEIGVRELHLLPYHRMGENKYGKLNRVYSCTGYTLSEEEMKIRKHLAEEMGLTVRVGG